MQQQQQIGDRPDRVADQSKHKQGNRRRSREAMDDADCERPQPLVEPQPAEPGIESSQWRVVFVMSVSLPAGARRVPMDIVTVGVDTVSRVTRPSN